MKTISLKSVLLITILLITKVASSQSGRIQVLDQIQGVHFNHGIAIYNSRGEHIKSTNSAETANVKAYQDVNGVRRFYSDWSWNRYIKKGIDPNFFVARAPQKPTKSLNFAITEDIKPKDQKSDPIRALDFDYLPDHGKNSGKRWAPRSNNGKVNQHQGTLYTSADFQYEWGGFNIYWHGRNDPSPVWERGAGNDQTNPGGVTHRFVTRDGKKYLHGVYHPTKHICLYLWLPTRAGTSATIEHLEILAKQYFEILEPYAQPRKNPIQDKRSSNHQYQPYQFRGDSPTVKPKGAPNPILGLP